MFGRKLTIGTAFAVMLSLINPALAQLDLRRNLTVEVKGLVNQEGSVCFKLFSRSRGFPKSDEGVLKKECKPIANLPLVIEFSDLQAGSYALAIFHDANDDRVLNSRLFGIPIEGYGFSNDAPAKTGPAKFEDAIFVLGGSNMKIEITMQYL